MAHVTRRVLLLSSAALSVGCAIRGPGADASAQPAPDVRQPVVGQSWRYAKHDIFTRAVVDEQVDRVATVDHSVEIDSSYQAATSDENAAKARWGAANQDGSPWRQTMKAHAWETISVPAGQFRALRYTNMIQFQNDDSGRKDSLRQETLWFAPEVGRWVARESTGSYYLDDSVADQPFNESGFRWELLEWS